MWKVYARLHGRRLSDSEDVLGEAFGQEYDSEEEARDVARFLEDGLPECDPERVHQETGFCVEEE